MANKARRMLQSIAALDVAFLPTISKYVDSVPFLVLARVAQIKPNLIINALIGLQRGEWSRAQWKILN